MHSTSLRSWSSYIPKTTTVTTSFVWRLSGERLRGDAHFHGNHCFPPRASQSQARSNESGARLLIPSPAFVPTEGEVIFTPIQDCCLRKCFVHETTFSCLSRWHLNCNQVPQCTNAQYHRAIWEVKFHSRTLAALQDIGECTETGRNYLNWMCAWFVFW